MFIPTIVVEIRAQSTRRSFDFSIEAMTEDELAFLADVFAKADKDQFVEFGLGHAEDGRSCMQFVIGKRPES